MKSIWKKAKKAIFWHTCLLFLDGIQGPPYHDQHPGLVQDCSEWCSGRRKLGFSGRNRLKVLGWVMMFMAAATILVGVAVIIW